jgi:hypothetical protein
MEVEPSDDASNATIRTDTVRCGVSLLEDYYEPTGDTGTAEAFAAGEDIDIPLEIASVGVEALT